MNWPGITFTKIDLAILEGAFETRCVQVLRNSPANLIRTLLASGREAAWADVTVAWFGSYFAFLPLLISRILGKKSVIIASGYDVANLPEIKYGNMRPGIRGWIGRINYALADKILAVSEFTKGETIANAGADPAKVETIVHGVPDTFSSVANQTLEKRQQVLSVGTVSHNTVDLKGIWTLVRVAALLPETTFLLVGPQTDDSIGELRAAAPNNLQFLGPLYGESLHRVMKDSKVYAQLSAYESFGMAWAESMMD